MNPVFGARKRAEEFHSMLEAQASRNEDSAARYADLLPVVTLLRETPAPEARPAFVADLRSRLMLAAEGALAPVEQAPQPAREVRRSPRERRIAAAIGGFAIVSATASMAVAAQTALPGDTLYPLKRAIENANTGVQRDADDKGATMLENASGRLAEVDELTRSGSQDPRIIAETLQDFVNQATAASDLLLSDFATNGHAASIAELRTFTSRSIDTLDGLGAVIPVGARSSLIEAALVIRQIEQQAVSACPACSDLPLTEMPAFAAQTVEPLLGTLLKHDAAAMTAAAAQARASGKSGPRKPVGQPAPSVDVAPSEVAVDQPDPVIPTGPKSGPASNGSDDGSKKGGRQDPIEAITAGVSNSEDPVGDLIAGTGAVAEKAVKDVTKSLRP